MLTAADIDKPKGPSLEVVKSSTPEKKRLTKADKLKSLEADENIIHQGIKTFMDAGLALARIKEGKKYRVKNYDSFEDYCRIEWGFSKSHANRLIDAGKVQEDLTPIGVTLDNESQARPLAKLDTPEEKQAAWKEAEKSARYKAGWEGKKTEPKVTAKILKKVVDERVREKAGKEFKRTVKPKPALEPTPSQKNEAASAEAISAMPSLHTDVLICNARIATAAQDFLNEVKAIRGELTNDDRAQIRKLLKLLRDAI